MNISVSVLDHYYLELSNGSIAVAVGNAHTPYCIVGYVKYQPTARETLWTRSGVYYDRLVKTYNPNIVRESTSWYTYLPYYDSMTPCIPLSSIRDIYDPISRSIEILHIVRDPLEKDALEIVSNILENTNIIIGLTGSILPRIHNPVYSDVDLVVYGTAESLDVLEYIENNKELYHPLEGARYDKWCINVALNTGLTPREASKFYRNWRRGLFNDREYSIIYNNGIYRDALLLPAFTTIGAGRFILEIDGGVHALNYPSIGIVNRYRTIDLGVRLPFDIIEVMSFEASFLPGLYEGGLFEVSGVLQCSNTLGYCRILIGVHEFRGYMKYYG